MAGAGEAQGYGGRELLLSMAGRGDPWSHLRRGSIGVLLALHEGLSGEGIEDALDLEPDSLLAEIQRLEGAGLVKLQGDRHVPDFFIANREEAEAAFEHARRTGEFLAAEVRARWPDLEVAYAGLSIHKTSSLRDLGFFLVGGRILDIGMLGALVDEGSLLRGAPARPSPGRPGDRYYFWGVEGDPAYLGRYGENTIDLGATHWCFATFGANRVNGGSNRWREEVEARFQELLEKDPGGDPESFARELDVPYLNLEDSQQWARISSAVSAALVARLLEAGPDIPGFFQSLRGGKYAPDRLPDFVAWYYHLAYAWAIDHLIEAGTIAKPPGDLLAFILFIEEEGGILKGLRVIRGDLPSRLHTLRIVV